MLLTHLSMSLPLLQDLRPPVPGRPPGRLMVVGDTKQMGPLLAEQYPEAADGLPPVHASGTYAAAPVGGGGPVELARAELQRGLVSSLQENHRMCDQLARLAREVLGYAEYTECHRRGCPCSKRWRADGVAGGVPPLRLRLDCGHSAGCAAGVLRTAHAFVMAALVAEIVWQYLRGARPTWGRAAADGRLDESVFVVTPHHVQRVAVLRAIEERQIPLQHVEVATVEKVHEEVATVEKMQGQERDLVVACYAGLDLDERNELGFAYSRERLNVAVSRAKKKCVLLCSPAAEMRAGLELLRRISEACGDGSCDYATTVVHTAEAVEGMDVGLPPRQGDPAGQASVASLSPRSRDQSGGQSCGAGSQVAIDDDETEDEGEGEGAPPPLVVPVLPLGEATPTDEDEELARHSLAHAPTAGQRAASAELRETALELRVPLEALSRRPWALVPYEDWPALAELPAFMRGWARRGVVVRPVPPGRVEVDWYTPALHAAAVDLHKKVAAQIHDGCLR
ncbi:hypothetical protein EMIHUDRAFT_458027 [Emiliania huxleyi CCMP1516]|uniref:DNA2/NAM7 helicase-like C-terminal domain-containing protein n=2 Tax=Emiliania huxleyi TaxID=2903 RepID=A0A0D3JIU4_EMIH1|nr:hypothetical protein EMIHUDRAFT_458027 [Emiliania huxleyi CCMP1516]EOD23429.1 hypothetical protein EMIHUDRAFT_458027 [Emiliania huxleyi CCMP1516]|eukprot:XP_005775858.1 hypothetical protein EMIHUDRAFT_458027 [Emiliania huxleyi CCMP1516]